MNKKIYMYMSMKKQLLLIRNTFSVHKICFNINYSKYTILKYFTDAEIFLRDIIFLTITFTTYVYKAPK